METNEIRLVNANQEKGKVFFHTFDNKTIVRTMAAREIAAANRIGNLNGKEARIEEFVRLFNEKYSEPQKIEHIKMPEEERFWMLHHIKSIRPLSPDEEEEYKSGLWDDFE